MQITILGAGNLGLSIAKGLEQSGLAKKGDMTLAEKVESRREMLKKDGYNVVESSADAVSKGELVFLVVKPWQADILLDEIASTVVVGKHVLVSCVTGLCSSHIFDKLGKNPTLFRVMPNTGIAIGESMSCIAAFNETPEQKDMVNAVFSKLGKVLFMSEDQMPAATAMSGCGIAYALRFIRAATEAGVEVGFSAADATLLAAQMTKGAAELILKNGTHPEAEIDKVTTPKGVTITALNEMEHNGFSSSIIAGIMAAFDKMN